MDWNNHVLKWLINNRRLIFFAMVKAKNIQAASRGESELLAQELASPVDRLRWKTFSARCATELGKVFRRRTSWKAAISCHKRPTRPPQTEVA